MSKNIDTNLITVFGAGLIGAGIGMLFAAEKGSVTRKRLKENLDDSIYHLKETVESIVDTFKTEKIFNEGTYDDLQPNMTYKEEEAILFL